MASVGSASRLLFRAKLGVLTVVAVAIIQATLKKVFL